MIAQYLHLNASSPTDIANDLFWAYRKQDDVSILLISAVLST